MEEELSGLSGGGVRDGFTYIYQLWKSLLNVWFGEEGTRVYLASPFIDTERLADVVEMLVDHKPNTNLEAFYTRTNADDMGKKKTAEMKREVLLKFDEKLGPFIEFHVYRNIMYPMRRFHAKFLAGVKEGVAKILVTSANFHGNHFAVENYETVVYMQMPEEEFLEKYIKPISAPVVVTM